MPGSTALRGCRLLGGGRIPAAIGQLAAGRIDAYIYSSVLHKGGETGITTGPL
jgi:hypothetical protein